jgi:hypothetical protein
VNVIGLDGQIFHKCSEERKNGGLTRGGGTPTVEVPPISFFGILCSRQQGVAAGVAWMGTAVTERKRLPWQRPTIGVDPAYFIAMQGTYRRQMLIQDQVAAFCRIVQREREANLPVKHMLESKIQAIACDELAPSDHRIYSTRFA